jgi:signal transduction histidine kinase
MTTGVSMTGATGVEDRLAALAAAAAALAGELSLDAVLETIVDVAARVTGGRFAALGVIGAGGTIERFVHRGVDEATVRAIGHLPRGRGLLGLLIREPRIIRTDDIAAHPASYGFPPHHPPMGSFLGAPVRSGGRVYGNLYLTQKPGGFTEHDERLIAVLAAQAGAAIENAELASRLQSLAVADERDRISRELHDGVIQALFSIGLGLESARGLVRTDPDRVDQRLDAAVDALDGAIRELRASIFHLRPRHAASLGLAGGLAELAREHEVNALLRPRLDIDAGIDARVPEEVVPDVLQVVREALANCARHAGASSVTVAAGVRDAHLVVAVSDDGVGFVPGTVKVGRGLEHLRERADVLGATLDVDSAPGRGSTVRLSVPLEGGTAAGSLGMGP